LARPLRGGLRERISQFARALVPTNTTSNWPLASLGGASIFGKQL
jgi:hypothetical protein